MYISETKLFIYITINQNELCFHDSLEENEIDSLISKILVKELHTPHLIQSMLIHKYDKCRS